MTKEFLRQMAIPFVYCLGEGTATSYYRIEGANLLPRRLSVSFGFELHNTKKSGRNRNPDGTLDGRFKKAEESPLKRVKPFELHTSLYRVEEFPTLWYGTIGISKEGGGKIDTGDLIIVQSLNDAWKSLKVVVFKGCGVDDCLMDALEVVQNPTLQ